MAFVGFCMGSVQQVQEVRFLDLQKALTLQSPTKARSQITPNSPIPSKLGLESGLSIFPMFGKVCIKQLVGVLLLLILICTYILPQDLAKSEDFMSLENQRASSRFLVCKCLPCHSSPDCSCGILWSYPSLLPKRLESTMPSLFLQCLKALCRLFELWLQTMYSETSRALALVNLISTTIGMIGFFLPNHYNLKLWSTVASSLVSQHTCAFKILLASSNCKETLMYLAKTS
jgi:hypothetical protein